MVFHQIGETPDCSTYNRQTGQVKQICHVGAIFLIGSLGDLKHPWLVGIDAQSQQITKPLLRSILQLVIQSKLRKGSIDSRWLSRIQFQRTQITRCRWKLAQYARFLGGNQSTQCNLHGSDLRDASLPILTGTV